MSPRWIVAATLAACISLLACGGGGGSENTPLDNNPGGTNSDTKPPSVSLNVDRTSVTETSAVTLTATASDDSGIEKVDFIENDVVIESVKVSPYVSHRTYTIDDNGSKRIVVKVYDKAGNVSSSTVIVILVNITVAAPADTSPPSVALNVPQTTVTSAGDFMVIANATDNVGVTKVEFYRGDTLVCADTTSAYQHWDKFTAADNGSVTYIAKAYDAAGNVTTSQSVTVTANIPTPKWSVTDLGTLGGSNSYAHGINDAGEVVGSSYTGEKEPNSGSFNFYYWHAFWYKNGKMIDLGTLNGGTRSEARSINNAGQIVGFGGSENSGPYAFLYQNGRMTSIGPEIEAGNYSQALVISDAGEIGGEFFRLGMDGFVYNYIAADGSLSYLAGGGSTASEHRVAIAGINNAGQMIAVADISGESRSYLYDNGTITDLGMLSRPPSTGCMATGAYAINNHGQIVGSSRCSAFLYHNGTMTDLAAILGVPSSAAIGINDSGQIVGSMRLATTKPGEPGYVFLYNNGNVINLTELPEIKAAGWSIYDARGINNSGQIIAQGKDENGHVRAVLLTPPK